MIQLGKSRFAGNEPVVRYLLLILILFGGFNNVCKGGTGAPERIVSLAPNLTETVFKLGAGNRLVGRTEFDLFPPQAQKIPSVGGYLNPDYEKIIALKPDLILMLPNKAMENRFRELGIPAVSFRDETVDDVMNTVSRLGKLLNLERRSRRIVAGIRDTLKLVRSRARNFAPLSAALFVGRNAGSLRGLYAAGKNTYLSQLWVACGGKNSFADVPRRYFNVSQEGLIRRNPDAILEFRIVGADSLQRSVSRLRHDWDALPTLAAVKTGHIKIFTDRYFLIPGPRISRMAIELSGVLSGFSGAKP